MGTYKNLSNYFLSQCVSEVGRLKVFLGKKIYSGWRLYGIQSYLRLGQESSLNMALDVTVHKGVKDFLYPNRETDYGNLTTRQYARMVAV